jgi:hypothetical protein
MGSGIWSHDTYRSRVTADAAAGRSTFAYSASAASTPRDSWKAHDSLDPKGIETRESRDSAEHPNATAIAVFFDVTGSMHVVPEQLQKKLPELFGLLLRKGFVTDPQIMMGAIGDAFADRVPLQVGQFESDNRIDDDLTNLLLEGGGGGGNHESYELALYIMARHTSIDCFEKHGRKGYLFIIGDERAYTVVSRGQVSDVIGDGLQEDISLADIVREVGQRYNVFYLHPEEASYVGDQDNVRFWTELLGQNYIQHVETGSICETIASLIAANEGTIGDMAELTTALIDVGASPSTVSSVERAVGSLVGAGIAVGTSEGPGLPGSDGTSGSRRI